MPCVDTYQYRLGLSQNMPNHSAAPVVPVTVRNTMSGGRYRRPNEQRQRKTQRQKKPNQRQHRQQKEQKQRKTQRMWPQVGMRSRRKYYTNRKK